MTERDLLRRRSARLSIVVAGIIAGQIFLYGDSLMGRRILLPLDYLALPGIYLPQTPDVGAIVVHNRMLSDQVTATQLQREFASRELRAGRLPLWSPYGFSGAPFTRFAKYSPFNLVFTVFPTPVSLAWIELFKSLVAGLGAYLFFKRALHVGFWPACVGGWCYPVTGFLVLWQGFEISMAAVWTPWLMLIVDETVRRPKPLSGPGLALLCCTVLISGQVDVAGQVLLASALYALLLLIPEFWGRLVSRPAAHAALTLALGWAVGLALATPFLLPLLDYSATGARMQQRAAGSEERPPVGLAALPEIVLPSLMGSHQPGSLRIVDGNRMEAAPAAYVGLLATLLLAPLAACSARHRASSLRWLLLGFLGLAWLIGVPGIVALLRLPPLNMFSHNRLLFLTGFALLSLAVIGLDVIRRGAPAKARRLWPFALIAVGLYVFCVYRSLHPPDAIAALVRSVAAGNSFAGISDISVAREILASFQHHDRVAALLAAVATLGWILVLTERARHRLVAPIIGALMLGELLYVARDVNPQVDPALYYPRLPVLSALSESNPGRVLGFGCLPPRLSETHELRDVRGYDGVDPQRMVELLDLAADHHRSTQLAYAATQGYVPKAKIQPPDRIELPPVLDLLGVRYVIVRSEPPEGYTPMLVGDDYWVLENREALPRVFMPRRVEQVDDAEQRLRLLGDDSFDPRAIAYVEGEIDLPAVPAVGVATLVDEVPTRLTIEVDADTEGLVVLADQWDAGWQATLDGRGIPVRRVNHAIRGVLVPAGTGTLVFEYAPASLALGTRLMVAGGVVLAIWVALSLRRAPDYRQQGIDRDDRRRA